MRSRPIAVVLLLLLPLLAGGDMGQSMSALKRAILASNPVAYWPLEDGSDATQGGAAAGAAPMLVTAGTVTWAGESDLVGSQPTPTLTSAILKGVVVGGSSSSWHVEFAFRADAYPSGQSVARIYTDSATHYRWSVLAPTGPAIDTGVLVVDFDFGITSVLTGDTIASFEGVWQHFAVTAEQVAGDVVIKLYVNGSLHGTATEAGTVGRVVGVELNPLASVTSASHAAVGDGTTLSGAAEAMDGYVGETAATRFARLCTEAGVAYDVAS